MTILDDRIELDLGDLDDDGPGERRPDDSREGPADRDEPVEPSIRVPVVVAAAAIASLAAAWMVTRLFVGSIEPLAIAAAGVAVGVGMVYLSTRPGVPDVVQYAVLPVAGVLGAVLATTGAGAGESLPAVVADALSGGGLLEPPIPLDPGWKLLLVLLLALVGAGACASAISLRRPKLAVGLPLLVTLGAALIQPKGSELLASAVAIVLIVAALAIVYGADLASEGAIGGGFEVRRLLRGGALLVVVMVGLVALAQTDFLFPSTDENEVIPPMKPPTPPPEEDRLLFTVESSHRGPWRLGVLDVYDDDAFMLPSIDPARIEDVDDTGVLAPATRETYEATFTVVDVKGQSLPGPPNPVAVHELDEDAEYDPRTQVLKLRDTSVPDGLTYTVDALVPPDGQAMAAAPPPAPAVLDEFGAMPPPPPAVQEILAAAPADNLFDRLQFVRQALYGNVIAAGAGRPVDIVPAKVAEMLEGGEATPYEIVAAETMLARWAGVPARIGYGFFGGEEVDGALGFRPKHGAAFLEAYFEGLGWVPVLGTPPKAKASLSDEQKNPDPKVVPTDELALTVFVPVQHTGVRLLYELVRYYAVIVVPTALGLLALAIGYPAFVKMLRSARRRRWAQAAGGTARIGVAYVELRDRMFDLNIGDNRHTPLEFLSAVADDDEHEELAWLVTRALWGDLARDLQIEDVEAAEQLARSVTKRVQAEQSALNRVLAGVSRASLRDPWSEEVPNLWRRRRPGRLRAAVRRRMPTFRPLRPRIASFLLVLLALGGCAGAAGEPDVPTAYPDPLLPATAAGHSFERQAGIEDVYGEPDNALVSEGRVYTINDGGTIQGSLQIALFKSDVDGSDSNVRAGIESSFGPRSSFRTHRFGLTRLRVLETAEQQIYLWFPPERNVMELFVMRKDFADAGMLVRQVVAHQRGIELMSAAAAGEVGP